jgi:hypothetical protein
MKHWKLAMRRAAVSGTLAGVLSAILLAARGKGETNRVLVHINIISHWLWDEDADRRDGASLKYTATGYLIHHASATFWALLHELVFRRTLDRRQIKATLQAAAATTVVACVTDYQLTPPRLRPGFERRLSAGSLLLVYAAFGAGLAAGSLLSRSSVLRR